MKKLSILLAFLVFAGFTVHAQMQITGTVTSAKDGLSIPGVSIWVKSQPTIGTTTDIDGKYTLSVPSDAQALVFSFVGMKETEVPIDGRTLIDVVMEEEVLEMDEVIVVAYGVQRREAKTGAVAQIKTEEIEDVPITSAEKLLQGRIAGVQLNSTTGQPGGASQIRIRGFSSINSSNEPLYVIDGVAVASGNYSYSSSTGNILATMNPSDIESITVLKDASAASIYGSRAANGVILINTKSGKKGDTKFNVRGKYGFSHVANDQDHRYMNADEIYTYMRDAINNSGLVLEDQLDPLYGAGFFVPEEFPADQETFDWLDAAFRNASFQEYEFTSSGGNENTSFFTSGSYLNQEGVMITTGMERFSFRTNLDQKVNDKLRMGTKINGSYMYMQDRPNDAMYFTNPFWGGVNALPWHLPYNDDGTFNLNVPSNSGTNFLRDAHYEENFDKTYKFNGQVYAEFEIIPGLKFKTVDAIEFMHMDSRTFWDPREQVAENGSLFTGQQKLERLTTTNTLSFDKIFADVHSVRALIGQEAFRHQWQQWSQSAYNLGYKLPYLSNATDADSGVGYGIAQRTLMSYFANVNYNYDERYYFQGSIRRDGNSKFGIDTRWGTFWSVAGSWNLHNESFLESISMINNLKLRASYGINGNDGIGTYDQYGTYASGEYNGLQLLRPTSIETPSLGWELNTALNIGMDFALFRKVTGSFEYYNRVTTEMLLDVPISRTSGFGTIQQNIGELKNTGIELELGYTIMNSNDINWDANFHISRNVTELIDLAGADEISDGWWRRHRVGGGYSDYYVYNYAGVNPATGNALWYDDSGNVSERYADADRVYRGQIEPDFQGGLSTSASWKGLTLSLSFEYKFGHYFYAMERRYTNSDGYNWGSNQMAIALDYWQEEGDVAGTPKPYANNNTNSNAWGTGRFLERGDYVRFKDITLSYNLPKNIVQKVKLDNVRVYFSGVNLYTWHDVSYWDPERSVTGGAYIAFPQAKTYTFGLEVGF